MHDFLSSIDLDLPLEVDDEYLTPEAGFTQPPNKPSQMAYFNYSVKLSQILIGALRTIVSDWILVVKVSWFIVVVLLVSCEQVKIDIPHHGTALGTGNGGGAGFVVE